MLQVVHRAITRFLHYQAGLQAEQADSGAVTDDTRSLRPLQAAADSEGCPASIGCPTKPVPGAEKQRLISLSSAGVADGARNFATKQGAAAQG